MSGARVRHIDSRALYATYYDRAAVVHPARYPVTDLGCASKRATP